LLTSATRLFIAMPNLTSMPTVQKEKQDVCIPESVLQCGHSFELKYCSCLRWLQKA
jgi:hypothetical protein